MKVVRALVLVCVLVMVGGAFLGISGDILKYVLIPLIALFDLQVIDWCYGVPKEKRRAMEKGSSEMAVQAETGPGPGLSSHSRLNQR